MSSGMTEPGSQKVGARQRLLTEQDAGTWPYSRRKVREARRPLLRLIHGWCPEGVGQVNVRLKRGLIFRGIYIKIEVGERPQLLGARPNFSTRAT